MIILKMKQNMSNSTIRSLSDITNPSALVSFQFACRGLASLSGIERFKNLAELDVSGNSLVEAVKEIFALKFLKKLNASNNSIEEMWELPSTLEQLNLSHNSISNLYTILPSLTRLQFLEISHNRIKILSQFAVLPSLKSLNVSYNEISRLYGLEEIPNLIELDLEGNQVESIEELSVATFHTSLSVLNLRHNPVQIELSAPRIFSDYHFPGDYNQVEDGLYYRRGERLKQLRSTLYRYLNRKLKKSQELHELLASPDWGYSKRSIPHLSPGKEQASFAADPQTYRETVRTDESHIEPVTPNLLDELLSSDSFTERSYKEVTLMKEDFIVAAQEARLEVESEAQQELEKDLSEIFVKKSNKFQHPIARLPLEKLSSQKHSPGKTDEKWSTKPESNIEALFDELITYCHLDDDKIKDKEWGFSTEKYELAINILKEREDERKELLKSNSYLEARISELELQITRVNMHMCDVEGELFRREPYHRHLARLRRENKNLAKQLDEVDSLKSTILTYKSRHDKLTLSLQQEQFRKQELENLVCQLQEEKNMMKLSMTQELSSLQRENEALRGEIIESNKGLLEKIRELESKSDGRARRGRVNASFDVISSQRSASRRALSPIDTSINNSIVDLSYCKKVPESEGKVMINKKVGLYIEKLKEKLNSMQFKMKRLRTQRDKYKSQLDMCTEILGNLSEKRAV